MDSFDQRQVAATIHYIVNLLTNGGIEQALERSKPSRCELADLYAVLAEYGQLFTLPRKPPKAYLACSAGTPAELLVDIRLCVDGAPSDLVLRCTFFADQYADYYTYRIDDLLAP